MHYFQGSEAVSRVWVSSLPVADPSKAVAPTPSLQPWWGQIPLPWDVGLSPVALACFPWFVTGKRWFCLGVADFLELHPDCWDNGSQKELSALLILKL